MATYTFVIDDLSIVRDALGVDLLHAGVLTDLNVSTDSARPVRAFTAVNASLDAVILAQEFVQVGPPAVDWRGYPLARVTLHCQPLPRNDNGGPGGTNFDNPQASVQITLPVESGA